MPTFQGDVEESTYQPPASYKDVIKRQFDADSLALLAKLLEKDKLRAWKQNLSANDTGSYANSNIGYKSGSKNAAKTSSAGVSYIDSLAAAKAVADSLKAKNSADSLAAIQAADSLAANPIVANNNPNLYADVQNVIDSEDRSNVTRNILYGTGLVGGYGAQRIYRGARNEYRNTKAIKELLEKIYVNQNGVYTVADLLNERGISFKMITGSTTDAKVDIIVNEYNKKKFFEKVFKIWQINEIH